MICSNCGKENADGSTFCGGCGRPLPPSASIDPGSDGGRNSNLAVIIACIVVALAVIIGLIAFFIIGGSNEDDVTVLGSDTVVFDAEGSEGKVLAVGEDSMTVSALDGIEVGSVLVCEPRDDAPYGLIRRITSIEDTDGGFVLGTDFASLTDAIEKCDLEAKVHLTTDGMYELEARYSSEEQYGIIATLDLTELESFSGSMDTEGSGFAFAADVTFEISMHIDSGNADIQLLNRNQGELMIDIDETSKPSGQAELFSADIPVMIPMAGMTLPLALEVEGTYDASGDVRSGGVGYAMSLDKTNGVGYSTSDGMTSLASDASTCDSLEFREGADGKVDLAIEAGPNIASSLLVFGVAGPQLNVGLKTTMDASLDIVDQSDASADAFEIPFGTQKAVGRLTGQTSIPVSGLFVFANPFNTFDGMRDFLLNGKAQVTIERNGDATTSTYTFDGMVGTEAQASIASIKTALGSLTREQYFMEIPLFDTGDTIVLHEFDLGNGSAVSTTLPYVYEGTLKVMSGEELASLSGMTAEAKRLLTPNQLSDMCTVLVFDAPVDVVGRTSEGSQQTDPCPFIEFSYSSPEFPSLAAFTGQRIAVQAVPTEVYYPSQISPAWKYPTVFSFTLL